MLKALRRVEKNEGTPGIDNLRYLQSGIMIKGVRILTRKEISQPKG